LDAHVAVTQMPQCSSYLALSGAPVVTISEYEADLNSAFWVNKSHLHSAFKDKEIFCNILNCIDI
jgi:hypothetical protein